MVSACLAAGHLPAVTREAARAVPSPVATPPPPYRVGSMNRSK
jgi:hypothetical protein